MVKDVDVSLLKSFGVVKTANPFIKYIGYLLDDGFNDGFYNGCCICL